MIVENRPYIRIDTKVLLPVFVEGYLYTQLYFQDTFYMVEKSPLAILKDSIIGYGADYQGAKNSSKSYLGGSYILPLQISGQHSIYMFPTHSCRDVECAWIALDHYRGCDPIDSSECYVYLSNQTTININCKASILMKRYNNALKLKDKIEKFSLT
ncbi:hypothetical protein F7984_07345 [Pradoshia sp. D12]|nr:hypothetical protein A8L44_00935 [Bacillus sp. FJAT-27986]QFK71075.1 hypothetical protein F7984_07345 [Pradoshia sp. D12]TPF72867.1 hypothetical protein FHY44_03730 [Bacillus sp. D12]